MASTSIETKLVFMVLKVLKPWEQVERCLAGPRRGQDAEVLHCLQSISNVRNPPEMN